jgi:hypothetical protein
MGSSGAWKWKRAEPVAPPFVLLVDSLLLLFQIEWHELAGFFAVVKRKYRDRLEWKANSSIPLGCCRTSGRALTRFLGRAMRQLQ